MTREDAIGFLRTCVNSVLGHTDNFAPTEFVSFRSALEGRTFKTADSEVHALVAAPYFFKRTTLSILLAGVKGRSGAQYEHTLGNIAVIVPIIWPHFRDAEKWSVGQAYAEAVNAGNSAAVSALKKALVAVQGFDYVPETLRSQTFSGAASALINVHTSTNNFYNEKAAVVALVKLGSTIPWPAFPICMSALVAIYLGNRFGHTWDAQSDVEALFARLTNNQWEYYLNECLTNDQLILSKLAWYESPLDRWMELSKKYDFDDRVIKNRDVEKLINSSVEGNGAQVKAVASTLYNRAQSGR
jgi:hypothetical protein